MKKIIGIIFGFLFFNISFGQSFYSQNVGGDDRILEYFYGGTDLTGISIDPLNSRSYACQFNNGRIVRSKIIPGYDIIDYILGFTAPGDIFINYNDNSFWVTNRSSSSKTLQIRPISNPTIITRTVTFASIPYGIVVDPITKYFVVFQAANKVEIRNYDTDVILPSGTITGFTSPCCIAIDKGNYWYVTNNGNSSVSVRRYSDNVQTALITSAGSDIHGIAIDKVNGFLFVCSTGDNKINVFQLSTNTYLYSLTSPNIIAPWGIACSSSWRKLFITNKKNSTESWIAIKKY